MPPQIPIQTPQVPQKVNPPVFIWVLLIVSALIGSIEIWQATVPKILEKEESKELTTSDPLAGWKTYRNEEYGFEFKYPNEWVDSGRSIEIQNWFSKPNSSGFPEISVLAIELVKNTEQTIEEIINKEIQEDECPGNHIIKKYDKGTMYVLYCSASSESYVFLVELKDKNKLKFWYHDNFQYDWKESEKIIIFDQILSTFKFISTSTDDVSNWKTYRNEEYGFEFKYPANWTTPQLQGSRIELGCPDQNLGNNYKCSLIFNIGIAYTDGNEAANLSIDSHNAAKYKNYGKCTDTVVFIYNKPQGILFEDRCESYQANGIFDQILSTFKFTK